MTEATYNEEIIRRYLLGALSEAETEKFDELSVTDDEFEIALNEAEKELVDAYLKGQLSGDDLQRFEAYYLASPLRRGKVDFSSALLAFGDRSAPAPIRVVSTATPKTRWLSPWHIGWAWGFAVVALVLFIAGVLLVFQNLQLRRQVQQTQARHDELQKRELEVQKQLESQQTANAAAEAELNRTREEHLRMEEQLRSRGRQTPEDKAAIASLILTPQMRGASQIQTLTVSPGAERVVMQLQLEPNQYSTYSVALVDQSSGTSLWRGRARTERVGDRKSLRVSFRAALLRAGTYRMQVTGISAGGTEVVGDYPFRVLQP